MCYADEHYMMGDTRRFGAIIGMVEQGKEIFAVWL